MSHTFHFMVQYQGDKEAWPKKRERKREREEYELTKLNFIEADKIQFDVDSVNIKPGTPDFCVFVVRDMRK